MRAVIQRVRRAEVRVDDEVVGSIGAGLCVLVGATHDDGLAQISKIARKIAQLRILRDADGGDEARRSAEEAGAPVLLVSQFTLYADVRKGRSPGWSHAAPGDVAEPMVAAVGEELRGYGLTVETGRFGAYMDVELVNDGPFTILLEA
ncbi:MAG: D-aminoacyl-tRNA deacylase [Actinomycetaceae bacterium]|nr:D-aminoacyl-tRNA deacylase [Actinomycetaceae bacterium]